MVGNPLLFRDASDAKVILVTVLRNYKSHKTLIYLNIGYFKLYSI